MQVNNWNEKMIREVSSTEFSMNKLMNLKDVVRVPRSSDQHISRILNYHMIYFAFICHKLPTEILFTARHATELFSFAI